MVTLAEVRGQTRVVELLRRAIRTEKVAHAYLFAGPQGVGKFATALAFAAALNCEHAPGEGCRTCASCERIANGLHPDVLTLERQGASQKIPIEVIRQRVIPAMGLAPHEGRARVFLIEEATSMLDPAANALLKTLEEPPLRTHFILCSSSVAELLPTIKSRCQRVVFQPLPADIAAEVHKDGDAATQMAEIASTVDQLIDSCGAGDRLRLLQLGDALGGERGQTARAVRLLAQGFHRRATDAAHAGDVSLAARLAGCAKRALDCEMALTTHNAHAQLAIDHLVRDLDAAATLQIAGVRS